MSFFRVLIYQFSLLSFADEIPGPFCDNDNIITYGDQYKVVSKMQNNTYVPNVNCSITFRGEEEQKMLLRIINFSLDIYTPQCKGGDKLIFYDGNEGPEENILMEECGQSKSLPNYYQTESNAVTVRFISNDKNDPPKEGHTPGFSVLVTPYYDAKNDSGM